MAAPKPSLMEMIRALIETPSVSSVIPALDMGNGPVINRLAEWLDDLGFQVEVLPLDAREDKVNLVATSGSGADGLVLSGHTDTVPYNEEAWRYDPLRLTESDDRLYGLGTSDMKAFFALALSAASAFSPRDFKRPLVILATADEESSMHGAKALSASGRRLGSYALIGEPTGLRPVNMHKGILMESIRVQGRAGHSSDPALGASALEGMHAVIASLLAWRGELQRRHQNHLFHVPVTTLNLGRIHGGDNPNRICGECELQIDLRPLPGMDIQELRGQLRERVRHTLADTGLGVTCTALFDGIPPMETDRSSAIVRVAEELSGRTAGTAAFGTEAPFLSRIGLETVVLGPGDVAQAHQPDEYLPLPRIRPTLELLQGLIHRFCVAEPGP